MSRSLVASMKLMLTGNVSRQARKYGNDLDGMGARGTRSMERLSRASAQMGDNFGMLVGRAGAFGAAYFGAQGIRRVMAVEERYERLGIAADKTTEEMATLRGELEATAEAEDIRVNPDQILAAIEKITEATGDFDLATSLQRELGLAIQATGSAGDEIGALVASISAKFDIKTPEGMRRAIDLLAKQGKAGAIELSNLASLGPKVFSAYASVGKSGVEGLAEAGALMQVFKRGVGGPDQAATVFENVFNALSDSKKLSDMKKKGVDIKGDDGEIVDPLTLIRRVVEVSGGDDLKLGSVFDAEAMRGMRQISAMLRKDSDFSDLQGLIDLVEKADGGTLEADSARAASTGSAQTESSLSSLKAVATDALMEPVQAIADALSGIDKSTMENMVQAMAALTAAIVAAKAARGVASLLGPLVPRKGGVGEAAEALAGDLGVVRVFVTNPGFGGAGGKGVVAGPATAAQTTVQAAFDKKNAANSSLRQAMVDEAAGNAKGRAIGGGLTGILAGFSAVSAVNAEMQGVLARRDDLMSTGLDREDAFSQSLSETQQANSDAFDAFLGRNLPSFFGFSAEQNPARDALISSPAPFASSAGSPTPADSPLSNAESVDLLREIADETREVSIATREMQGELSRGLKQPIRRAPMGESYRQMVTP